MKNILILLTILASSQLWADLKTEVQDLDNRLFDLEEKLQGKFPVSPIDAQKLRIGGTIYHDQRYAVNKGDHRDSLISTTRMDILMSGELTDKIDFIFVPAWFFLSDRSNKDAANRSAAGNRQTMNLVYRLNTSYKFNANNALTIGRFVTPFGSYVDTYSPSADNMSYWPQMVIPMGGVTFSPVLDGLLYKGQHFFKSFSWKYSIYGAIHSTDGGSQSPTGFQKYLLNGTPTKHHYGFRTIFSFWHSKIQFGLSGQFGERFYGTNTYRKFAVYGADLNVHLGKFHFRSEWMKTNEGDVPDNSVTAPTSADITMSTSTTMRDFQAQYLDSNKESYYVEMTYRINEKFMLATRYDYADFHSILFAHGKPLTIMGITLNYFPVDKLMLKISADKYDYDATSDDIKNNPMHNMPGMSNSPLDSLDDPDYMEYSVSATLSF